MMPQIKQTAFPPPRNYKKKPVLFFAAYHIPAGVMAAPNKKARLVQVGF